jgi:hypothetical protein
MPILGVVASSISGNLYSASYDSISTVTVGAGGASSIDITNIPQTYTHLQLRFFARTNRSTYNVDEVYIYANADTTLTNYAGHYLWPNNNNFPGTVVSGGGANFPTPYIVGANNGNAPFGGWVVDILDYTNTNKFKTIKGLGGADSNGDVATFCCMPELCSSLWKNTNAITSLRINMGFGTSFNQYSSFALYGIKVA